MNNTISYSSFWALSFVFQVFNPAAVCRCWYLSGWGAPKVKIPTGTLLPSDARNLTAVLRLLSDCGTEESLSRSWTLHILSSVFTYKRTTCDLNTFPIKLYGIICQRKM